MKSKATGCGSISTVFSSIVLLYVSSTTATTIIIIIIIIIIKIIIIIIYGDYCFFLKRSLMKLFF